MDNSARIKLTNKGTLPASFTNSSLSWGTMKEKHLLDSFGSFLCNMANSAARKLGNDCYKWIKLLEWFDKDSSLKKSAAKKLYTQLVGDGWDTDKAEDNLRDSVSWFLNESVWNYLESISPTGYFGSSEGDGTDYGFWSLTEDDNE
jgi:hypothetical protein